jgi:hypothetical protein
MSQDLYVSLGIGATVGIAILIAFAIYGGRAATASTIAHTVFGTSVHNFVEQFFVSLIAMVFIVLSALAFIVRDGKFPVEHPWEFAIETLAMGFVPAILFLGSTYLRGAKRTFGTLAAFLVLVAKCGIGHVLLQYAGVYSAVFTR